MKVSVAQINTTPNDFNGNFEKIQKGIQCALENKSDVVVFPELTIPGYLVRDLIYTTGFIDKNLIYLNKVAKLTEGSNLTAIVGYIDRNNTGYGKPFRNMAAVIRNGVIIATHQKRLLPGYSVFEEFIYYEPGKDNCVFDINGKKCAVLICEEIWRNDKGETGNLRYTDNPISDLNNLGINYIFCINSSPYNKNKAQYRLNVLKDVAKEWKNDIYIIYVNQIGGQDELVFDGNSMIVTKSGLCDYVKNDYEPAKNNEVFVHFDLEKLDINLPNGELKERGFINETQNDHLKMILLGLYDYVNKSGFKSIVMGSSGGVDSALVATLSTLALGKENVNCIMMPSSYSSQESVEYAKELHKRLGCNEFIVPIQHQALLKHVNKHLGFKAGGYNGVADENIQARMRGQIIMHYSNAKNALALTTGNKSELSVGYTTLYGDSCGGFNPIGDLFKTEVYELCGIINKIFNNLIPESILTKKPSAELRPNQTDEASLLPYPVLDNILRLYVENHITTYDVYCQNTPFDLLTTEDEYKRITRLIYINEFKRRQAAPLIKLSRVAFGTGRRLPIVKK